MIYYLPFGECGIFSVVISRIANVIHRLVQLFPGCFQFTEKDFSFFRQPVIFTWRTLRRLNPFITQQVVVLQTGEQRIKCTFHYNQSGFFQLLNDIRSVSRLLVKQQHDAIFKHALAHLRLYIVYIHNGIYYLTIYDLLFCCAIE